MALLEVLTLPDPKLSQIAKPVERVDQEIQDLMDDMLETMYHEDGIGLAATQVGVMKRVIVMDVRETEDEPSAPLKMANPEILWTSEETSSLEEGCLSVPEISVAIVRPSQVKVRYLDEHGESKELLADQLLAKCIQHEIDHLNGICIPNYLSSLKKALVIKKLTKRKQQMA